MIKSSRRRAGISQAELAGLIGTSQPTIAAYETAHRIPSGQMLARILAAIPRRPSEVLCLRHDEVLAAAARHRAFNVRVFGSVARGSDRYDSDIDFLCFRPGATLFDQAALLADLEAIFGSGRVDLVSEAGLLARDDHIVTEAVPA